MRGYTRRTLFFPISLESGSAWASRLIPSLVVQSWGWREQAAALSICTVKSIKKKSIPLSWNRPHPSPCLMLFRLFRKTKEAMTKEIRIGAFLYLGILGCECKRYELVLLSIMIVD